MAFTRDELAAYEKGTAPDQMVAEKPATETVAETDSTADGDASDTATQSDADDTTTSDETSDTSTDGDSTASTDSSDDDGSSDESADSSTADAGGSKGDKNDDEDSAVEPPRGSRARERIEELVAERNSLRKYGEHLLARIEELAKVKGATASSTEETPKGQTKVDGDDPAPTLEQFKFDQDKFARAQNEWIDRQVEKRVNAAVQGIETKREAAAVAAKFGELENAVRKVHKDYDIVVANPNLPALARGTAAQIVRSDFGPYITYHLAKNPDLATRIARQSQEQQLVSIGGLIAKFQTDTEAAKAAVKTPPKPPQVKKKTVTTAPPPGKRVQGGGTVQRNVGEMSMDEFVAYDRAQTLKEKQMRQQLRSSLAR